MQMNIDPFMSAFGQTVLVNGIEVQAIVSETTDEQGAEFGHINSMISLEIYPADKDHFIHGATVQINGTTLSVFKEPITKLDGKVEVYLES